MRSSARAEAADPPVALIALWWLTEQHGGCMQCALGGFGHGVGAYVPMQDVLVPAGPAEYAQANAAMNAAYPPRVTLVCDGCGVEGPTVDGLDVLPGAADAAGWLMRRNAVRDGFALPDAHLCPICRFPD
jgi:hypothetical protein